MADHNKKGGPLTIRPLTAFFLPCERVHVWFHYTAPFRAQPSILPSTAAHKKMVIETPVSEWVMYLKGWLTWITNHTTGRKVYVLALASSCWCPHGMNTDFSESLSPPRSERTARETWQNPAEGEGEGEECKLQWTTIIIRWNSKFWSHFTLRKA